MLLPYLVHLAPLITISYLYLVLFLQSLLRIPKSGDASGILLLPVWEDLRRYNGDFPCNDYCCLAKGITEVIVSGMEAYIPHSFSQPKSSRPWCNLACYYGIFLHDREVAHKGYISLPSLESRVLYISAWNHAKSVLQIAKHSFIIRKCQKLSNSYSPRDFSHLAKNISNNFTSCSFSLLFRPDGPTAITSVCKAELFSDLC